MREIKFRAWDRNEKHFVYFELFKGVNSHTPPIYKHAELEEWKQYTGLKDKNGKEIYEGDVISFNSNSLPVRVVEWKESRQFTGFNLGIYTGKFEIIGNIYENPELIQTNKE